jgi:hypothetical protein
MKKIILPYVLIPLPIRLPAEKLYINIKSNVTPKQGLKKPRAKPHSSGGILLAVDGHQGNGHAQHQGSDQDAGEAEELQAAQD